MDVSVFYSQTSALGKWNHEAHTMSKERGKGTMHMKPVDWTLLTEEAGFLQEGRWESFGTSVYTELCKHQRYRGLAPSLEGVTV